MTDCRSTERRGYVVSDERRRKHGSRTILCKLLHTTSNEMGQQTGKCDLSNELNDLFGLMSVALSAQDRFLHVRDDERLMRGRPPTKDGFH